jgi:hypothetical protein
MSRGVVVTTLGLLPVRAGGGAIWITEVAFGGARAPVWLEHVPPEWGVAVCDLVGVVAKDTRLRSFWGGGGRVPKDFSLRGCSSASAGREGVRLRLRPGRGRLERESWGRDWDMRAKSWSPHGRGQVLRWGEGALRAGRLGRGGAGICGPGPGRRVAGAKCCGGGVRMAGDGDGENSGWGCREIRGRCAKGDLGRGGAGRSQIRKGPRGLGQMGIYVGDLRGEKRRRVIG